MFKVVTSSVVYSGEESVTLFDCGNAGIDLS